MNYLKMSNYLLYIGHIYILTGVYFIFTSNNYYLIVSMITCGQLITLVSKPISRLHDANMQNDEIHHDVIYLIC